MCASSSAGAADVVEMLRRASDSAPEAADLWQSWLRGRHAGATMVVRRDVVVAALRAGLTPEAAADVLWRLNDPDHYAALVGSRGWSETRFETWLGDTMVRLLL